jgi:hypothetical protein
MAIRKSSSSGIPFGNTAGRPANPGLGQLYSNGQTARLELYTETGWQNIVQETPGVASATGTYNQSAGEGTFVISGTNFVDGAIAYAVGTNGTEYQAASTTYNSLVQLTTVFSSLSPAYEPYDIKITNPSNLFGLLPDAFYINDSPVWSTTAGSLGTFTSGSTINTQLSATDDESNTITYTISSGSLPGGLSLSSSGLISGTLSAVSGTYTFIVSASDGLNTGQTRSFSISSTAPVVTGGSLTSDSTYYYRTFTGTGNFVVSSTSLPNTDILTVAGAGAGGWDVGGGGGAGGLTYSSSITLPATTYTVTIGAGGASPTGGSNTPAPSGTSTSIAASGFSTITSAGGGGGGNYQGGAGASGGSGGGGSGYTGGLMSAGSSTQSSGSNYTGYGYAGGVGRPDLYGNQATGGGGGGAGGTGSSSTNNIASFASGGPGLTYFGSTYAAGGKGGGDGWTGATVQSQNTGNGGDGQGQSHSTTGGSGIVIFRYTKASVGG